MANGACSTIASKMPRVMLCKTRELGGSRRRTGSSGWAPVPTHPHPRCGPSGDPATLPGREQRLPTGGHPEKRGKGDPGRRRPPATHS